MLRAGTWPAKLDEERFRWVSLLNRSKPVDGISDRLKSFPPRLRYSREPRSPKSSHVTRPSSPPPQRTPSHRQQSSPSFHDRKAVTDLLVMEKDRFSRSNADAWSGKHGTAGGGAPVWLVYVAAVADEEGTTSWVCKRSSNGKSNSL
uniref:Uncharacterized protein n=1 Tax=Oryza punctata TaxID=4537 RepID=A0A0E0JED8_ORYPU